MNKESIMNFMKKLYSNLIVVVALVLGFFIGYYSYIVQSAQVKEPARNPYTNVKSPGQISVAINDANEMLVIDRNSGEYEVYSDSVGIMIFKLYAGKIYQSTNQDNQ
jgi:hypothetical protein